jgi:hypothetical protein
MYTAVDVDQSVVALEYTVPSGLSSPCVVETGVEGGYGPLQGFVRGTWKSTIPVRADSFPPDQHALENLRRFNFAYLYKAKSVHSNYDKTEFVISISLLHVEVVQKWYFFLCVILSR